MTDESGNVKNLPERIKQKVEKTVPNKAAKQQNVSKQAKTPKEPKSASNSTSSSIDPDAMFKEGWLAGVRKERPDNEAVVTRFPPEPNGYLHVGHSKAIAVNFGFARYYGGKCNLRFDDTNPEAEEEIYFIMIEDIIRWLGFKPAQVTYSSDSFDKLYALAEKLILMDGAYVCHCSEEELKEQRGGTDVKNKKSRYACRHRDRPVDESLAEFRAMKDGKYKPREAFLRMKTDDFKNGNPQMWDLVAYRVLEKAHHRTGDQWRIYPTYDFTHCLCDSFEGITHSLCTTEFILSRESYEWLNNTLDVPDKPMQREYGRLDLAGTVLSKRKLKALVDDKIVSGWDDPRLYTLVALKRRGIPPGAILSFVNELGVTTGKTIIQIARFEASIRKYLEMTVPRLMLILDPIPVIIDDLPEDHLEELENAFGPKDVDMGNHTMPFTRKVYIERDDFREEDSKDFFRMAPGKAVGLLKVPFPVIATSFQKDESTGLVTEIHAKYDRPAEGEKFKKPKAYIHWVAESSEHESPVKAEVRVFHPLFKSDNPNAAQPSFMSDINHDSLKIYPNALVEVGFNEIRRRAPWPEEAGEQKDSCGPESVRFQGMRMGYFCMDKDSDDTRMILNRIVSLKEDSGKRV